MNSQIQKRLDSMEGAIDDLLASISAYNPSPAAAASLLEIDDAFSEDLQQLTQHQRNNLTLEQLRSTTEALDDRLKANLTSLADVRNELLKSTPVSVSTKGQNANEIDTDELLHFAQLIARAGLPSVSKQETREAPQLDATVVSAEDLVKEEISTPKPGEPDETAPNGMSNTQKQQNSQEELGGKALASLNPELRSWLLGPTTNNALSPWVSEEESRKSALSRIEETWGKDLDPEARG